ncbi:uncharacterized protein LOC135340440 isoform X1 [Halichondria panicea]|uniref:uncharacterized protein LOC135340440 isoform X1 n=1 Tax=Halichondria panicea TaxID=6063 RepID=UPI00312BB5C6
MGYPRSGPASRAVALDLMLRTCMNSADFHTSNPRIWDNIAKLVPGTTPQQCAQRWEELRLTNSTVAGDLSGLTATGRPISSHGRKQISKLVRSMLKQTCPQLCTRPHPAFDLSATQCVIRMLQEFH